MVSCSDDAKAALCLGTSGLTGEVSAPVHEWHHFSVRNNDKFLLDCIFPWQEAQPQQRLRFHVHASKQEPGNMLSRPIFVIYLYTKFIVV